MAANIGNIVTRWRFPDMQDVFRQPGFSLMEVMVGLSLSTLLMSGIVALLSGSVSAYRLQLSQDRLEESSRYARDVLVSHITQAGFQPRPWQNQAQSGALTGESTDGDDVPGDRLSLQRWSNRNCYGAENPVTDSSGQPAFYLLQAQFHVNSRENLAITCRYGPGATQLTTQINNYGLVEEVESMQLLYAEDTDDDGIADAWVRAQAWQREENIRSVKVALLLATTRKIAPDNNQQITLLDESISAPADGRLRRVTTFIVNIRGRLL